MRLDRWLRQRFPDVPLGALSKAVRTGQVRVDGGRAKMETRLTAGQTVRLPPIAPTGRSAPVASGDAAALDAMTLHRDDHVAVLNKPFGLAVQGGSGVSRHVDGMLEAWRDRKGRKPRLVHRLDRDTTGVLLVALTRSAAASLSEAFKGRETEKSYLAVTRGHPTPPEGRLATWLARDPQDGERMAVFPQKTKETQRATTLYETLDTSGQFALLALTPVTGRTHQLRVHCTHMGCPILGDPRYFNVQNWDLPGGLQNRLHLHARRIVIPHPAGGTLDISAPPPPHITQTLNVLGLQGV
ncbi:MAG: RluA family pseudouridine synthase [Pseudomonadota bacterium]